MVNQSDRIGRCKPAYRRVVLVLVLLHLVAVLAEPLIFFSRSDFQVGPEFYWTRRFLAPYVDWMYLDHGYFFFAPNPGPSHLVAIQKKRPHPPGPSRLSSDAFVFPDRKEQWPRLLYHRYFMLSEFYNNSFAPTDLLEPEKNDPIVLERWRMDRRFYEMLQRSIRESAGHWLPTADGGLPEDGDPQGLELLRLERPLPAPEEILKGVRRLGDSRDLMVLPEGPELFALPERVGAP